MPISIRLGEDTVDLVNVCPKTTLGELAERAGIRLPAGAGASETPAFLARFKYSTGVEAEELEIVPGQKITVPVSIGRKIAKDPMVHGVAMIASDEKDKTARVLATLRAARGFYDNTGTDQIPKLIDKKGYNMDGESEARRVRQRHYPYFLNEARAEILMEEEDRVMAGDTKGSGKVYDGPLKGAGDTKKVAA